MTKQKISNFLIRFLLSLILPVLIFALCPLQMSRTQALVLATLVLVITWWVINLMPKWVSSAFLLLVFLLFSGAPAKTVFQFPLSDNFIVILFAFLFSQGIANSGLAKRLLQPLLYRWIHTPIQFLLFSIVCNIGLIFIIPQPFARIILFAFLANEYLDDACQDKTLQGILMFSTFLFSISSNMMFLRGDIIMNHAILSFGEVSMTESSWAAAMAVPTLLLIMVEFGLLLLLYKKHMFGIRFSVQEAHDSQQPLRAYDWAVLVVVAATMLLMATESLHGIASKWVILASTVIMFAMRLLKLRDIKSINFNLLVWLTAAFSIGGVMRASGTADVIFSRLATLFPSEFGLPFLLIVVLITMVLHMVLGSSVTTTSVVVPGIVSIAAGKMPTTMLVMIIYVLVYNHFLLPLHNAVLVIGNGDKRFQSSTVTQYGAALTVVVPLFALFIYRYWWQLLQLF